MSEYIEAGDLSARHLGRRVMLPHWPETEGRLVGVHLMLIGADRVVRIYLEEDGRQHTFAMSAPTLVEVQP